MAAIQAFLLTGRIAIDFGKSRQELKALEGQTGGVAAKLKGLGGSVRDAVRSIGGELQSFGQSWSVAVTVPLTLASGAALKFAGDLQQAVANISTIKPEI